MGTVTIQGNPVVRVTVGSGGATSGPAGGALSGNYPNPGFAVDMATQAELNTHAATPHSDAAHIAATTSVHGISDTALLMTLNTVQTTTAGKTLAPASASAVALIVKGFASQTANLQEWQNSAGSVLAFVSSAGEMRLPRLGMGINPQADSVMLIAGAHPNTGTSGYGMNFDLTTPSTMTATSTALFIHQATAAAAFTANTVMGINLDQLTVGAASAINVAYGMKVENYGPTSAVAQVFGIDIDAQGVTGVSSAYGLRIGNMTGKASTAYSIYTSGGRHYYEAGEAATIPLTLQGAGSQSADLQRWINSGGSTLLAVTAAGLPQWVAAANQQTTVGAAGGASALPATPTKYLRVVDSAGSVLVIPAYAAV